MNIFRKKNKILKFNILILVSLLIFSCKQKEIEYFNLIMAFTEPAEKLKVGDPLPESYRELMNYYEDTISNKKIFVPVVRLERVDFVPHKTLNFEFPLTSLNKFRKSLGLLSGIILMDDYNKNISKLKVPEIMTEKKGDKIIELSDKEYVDAIKIILSKFDNTSYRFIRDSIFGSLVSGKANGNIELIYYNHKDEVDSLPLFEQDSSEINGIDTVKIKPEENPKLDLTAKSLEEYFEKIADKSISYDQKNNLKRDIITKYFNNENAQVIELGHNGTEVEHTNIKDYIEELSLQYYKIKIVDIKNNSNNKITTLYIEEL